MRVSDIKKEKGVQLPQSVRLSARIYYDNNLLDSELYWFEFPEELEGNISEAGDPWLIALLPLAININESIAINCPVDPFLLENAHELLDAWRFWHPNLPKIQLDVSTGQFKKQLNSRKRNAQFFSGGVDSFYTALRHGPDDPRKTDDLLFCWGFDVPLSNPDAMNRLKYSLRKSANKLDKKLIIAATNIRETHFGSIDWAHFSHGCAMASVALFLEPLFMRVLIPSSDGYFETDCYGSHAFTDHLFSTSNMHVIHDGSASTRQEKIDFVAQHPDAIEGLRVCWKTFSDTNCGHCEKCIRTMIDLELCGVLSLIPTFSHTGIDPSLIRRIYTTNKMNGIPLYYKQMLLRDEKLHRDDLSSALKICLGRSKIYDRLFEILSWLKKIPFCNNLTKYIEHRVLKDLIY